MQICNRIYQEIISSANELPPETGGLLGGKNGIVTKVVHDNGVQSTCGCSYSPDVNKFNKTIAEWKKEEIDFMGIFHTHFFNVETLSNGDKKYIERILRNMPRHIKELYFPIIVMPRRSMIVYKATLKEERVVVEQDKTFI